MAWHHLNLGGQWTFYGDEAPAPMDACVVAVLAYRPEIADHEDATPSVDHEDESPTAEEMRTRIRYNKPEQYAF